MVWIPYSLLAVPIVTSFAVQVVTGLVSAPQRPRNFLVYSFTLSFPPHKSRVSRSILILVKAIHVPAACLHERGVQESRARVPRGVQVAQRLRPLRARIVQQHGQEVVGRKGDEPA